MTSRFAGHANVIRVPDSEAPNMPVKNLTFRAGIGAAGIVPGARVPIILTSRLAASRRADAARAVV